MDKSNHIAPSSASLMVVAEPDQPESAKVEVSLSCDAHQSRLAVNSTKTSLDEPETKRTSAMGEASSLKRPVDCVSVDVTSIEENNPCKQQKTVDNAKLKWKVKRHGKRKHAASKKEGATSGRWTASEHAAFLRGLALYGREWKRVAADIPTRSASQVRSHAQKYFAKLQKDEEDEWIDNNNNGSNGAHHGDCKSDGKGLIPDPEPPMSDSVRREAARILAHPESVEAEVRSTLKQLRKRYVELQQRLEERSVGSNANHSAVSVEDEMIAVHVLQNGLKNERDSVNNS
jgi:SHAQKYF class myb-like DNA-binding protein